MVQNQQSDLFTGSLRRNFTDTFLQTAHYTAATFAATFLYYVASTEYLCYIMIMVHI